MLEVTHDSVWNERHSDHCTSGTRCFREDFAGWIHAFQGWRYHTPRQRWRWHFSCRLRHRRKREETHDRLFYPALQLEGTWNQYHRYARIHRFCSGHYHLSCCSRNSPHHNLRDRRYSSQYQKTMESGLSKRAGKNNCHYQGWRWKCRLSGIARFHQKYPGSRVCPVSLTYRDWTWF